MNENIVRMPPGNAPDIRCHHYFDGKWEDQMIYVPQELPLAIYINGRELVTILCSPSKLNFLVVGYLLAEGVIENIEDINILRVCEESSIADIRLKNNDYKLPDKRILTSGCGGGMSLNSGHYQERLVSKLSVAPEKLFILVKQMIKSGKAYRLSGGSHTSALCDTNHIIALGEDIGRHNTLDKIIGECLMRNISTKDKILITSGRIASEMLRKAVKMEIPMVVSLTSPTQQAIILAKELGVTLVGYVRGSHMTVYANEKRLGIIAKNDEHLVSEQIG